MRTASLTASLLAAGLSLTTLAATEKFNLDPTHTFPSFEVNHLGFSIMRGYFQDTVGTMELDREGKTGKLEAVVQTTSIMAGQQSLIERLKGKEFFNTAEFPSATIKVDTFKFDGDKPVEAQGSLTLLGVSKSITLKINHVRCDTRAMDKQFICGADVSTTIKRSDWGMKAYVPFVGDEVKILVEVEAVRQK